MSLDVVDRIPSNIPDSSFPAKLDIFEHNEAVIRVMVIGRSSHLGTCHELTVLTWLWYLCESICTVLFPFDMWAPQNSCQAFRPMVHSLFDGHLQGRSTCIHRSFSESSLSAVSPPLPSHEF